MANSTCLVSEPLTGYLRLRSPYHSRATHVWLKYPTLARPLMTRCLQEEAEELMLRTRCHSLPSIVRIRSPHIDGTAARPVMLAISFQATAPTISIGRRFHLCIKALPLVLPLGPTPALDSSYHPVLLAYRRLSSLIVSGTPLMLRDIAWSRPITGDVLSFSSSCAKPLITRTNLNA